MSSVLLTDIDTIRLSVLGLVLGLASLFTLYKIVIYPAFLSPLAKIPAAHWSCHVAPFWIVYQRWSEQENDKIYRLHEKLGPLIRIRPNELSVNCIEDGTKLLYWNHYEKEQFFSLSFVHYGLEPMFSMQDNSAHGFRKRMISNSLSKSFLLSAPDLKEVTKTVLFDRVLPIIHSSALNSAPLEVLRLNYAYSMDSFTNFQFGLTIGSNFLQDTKYRDWFLSNFHSLRRRNFWRLEFPNVVGWLNKFGFRVVSPGVGERYRWLQDWVLAMCDHSHQQIIRGKEFKTGEKPVIFSQMRDALVKADEKLSPTDWPLDSQVAPPQPYARRLEAACEMFDFIGAAHETSGITLSYAYWELSRRPDIIKRLREELTTLSTPFNWDPSNIDADLPDSREVDALPLLNAVVTETLRRWPAVSGAQPRRTPNHPTRLAGYDNIPPATKVQAYAYTMHRNKDVFPNPEEWNPDRWLTADSEHLKEMFRWYLVWGQGGRMCVGSNFAIYSMKSVLAAIYTNFNTSVVDDFGGINQMDGFTCAPITDKIMIQFSKV